MYSADKSCGSRITLVLFSALTLIVAVWYGNRRWLSGEDGVPYDVHNVLNGLLAAEAEATVRPGASVAVGFGGCLDLVANAVSVLNRLGATPPDFPENVNELHNLSELERAFVYFFSNGASAG